MQNSRYFTFFLSLCLIGIVSCGGDDTPAGPACSVFWGTELQNELNAIVTAGTAYADDPSDANCNAYKSAYQAYISALRPYGDCAALTGQNRTDFNQALNDAENELATLC